MMSAHQITVMGNRYDIGGYSGDGQLAFIGEIKSDRGATDESAKVFRRNLIEHDLLPSDVYFMLAYRTAIYLWKPQSGKDALPDFRAAAKPVLKQYLGEAAEDESIPGSESLEFAFKQWLQSTVLGTRRLQATSDADRMLLDSGLIAKLKGGEIRHELSA